jgi:hypothetical protein
MFTTPEQRESTSDPHISDFSRERIDRLAYTIITAVMFALSILPVVLRYKLSSADGETSPLAAIGTLIVSTLLFCVAMSNLAQATRQELFAASAAYCAVLVVFLSNVGTQNVKVTQ